jgi:F-type H+-transporting ATPase subunit gamma
MPSLKEIRSRIVSVNSTMQITSAMKMVSAAKLRRAQDAILQMRPYAQKLQEVLSNVSASLESDAEGSTFGRQREVKRVLVVAITSNRGLCGAFNNNVIKECKAISEAHAGAEIKVLSLGKKAFDNFRKGDTHYTEGFSATPYQIFDQLTFQNASGIANEIMNQFADGRFDLVYVVYNQFKNAAMQVVKREQYLPVQPPTDAKAAKADYIYEPGKDQILTELIPRSLKVQLYKALLDSNASEHGARMTAMHKATDNASDIKKELSLVYNKARQASITKEILEIVGGAEALNG